MNKENRDFLLKLQNELKTQETDIQANPRFWVVAQYEWIPCWEQQADSYTYSNGEGDYFDSFEDFRKYLFENEYIDEELYLEATDIDDLDNNEYYKIPQKKVHVIKENTFFLTKQACIDHIQANNYHYNETVHTYAMTAWRSPNVEKLIGILTNEKW
jgi:hypothetical protein